MIFFLLFAVALSAAEAPGTERLVIFEFTNQTGQFQLDNFHHYLRLKLAEAADLKEFTPEVWETPFAGEESFERLNSLSAKAALFGRFYTDSLTGHPRLSFSFALADSHTVTAKAFSVAGLSLEEIAKVVDLKVSSDLDNLFGRLLLSSTPPGCQIFLNGLDQGITPKEFFLKQGSYSVEIVGEHLQGYSSEVKVLGGNTTDFRAMMEFQGYPTHYWLWGALLFSGLSVISWIFEDQFQHAKESATPEVVKAREEAYESARFIRMGLISISALEWAGAGACLYLNFRVKKRIFSPQSINP